MFEGLLNEFSFHKFIRHKLHINKDELFFHNPCIGYVLKGKGEFLWQGKKYIASAGDLVYIAKGTKYRSFWTGNPEVEWYSLSFSFLRPSAYADFKFQILKNYPAETFHRIFKLYNQESLAAVGHFYILLDDLFTKLISTPQSEKESFISAAVRYIEENFTEKITIEHLANLCGCSQSYFFSLFKEVMGVSPITYKNHIAIQQAIRYLGETDLSIEEISSLTGFSSPNYFRRVFIDAVGKTPKELRG
ncbi:MAG: helix-turn-helix transcriptional regulator [Clostridia bacterium]|nr:helix-turn-helix transcriptional regulator [Clostridia bacterium]